MPTFVAIVSSPESCTVHRPIVRTGWINLAHVAAAEPLSHADLHPDRAGLMGLWGAERHLLGYCTADDFHAALAAGAVQLEHLREALEDIALDRRN